MINFEHISHLLLMFFFVDFKQVNISWVETNQNKLITLFCTKTTERLKTVKTLMIPSVFIWMTLLRKLVSRKYIRKYIERYMKKSFHLNLLLRRDLKTLPLINSWVKQMHQMLQFPWFMSLVSSYILWKHQKT